MLGAVNNNNNNSGATSDNFSSLCPSTVCLSVRPSVSQPLFCNHWPYSDKGSQTISLKRLQYRLFYSGEWSRAITTILVLTLELTIPPLPSTLHSYNNSYGDEPLNVFVINLPCIHNLVLTKFKVTLIILTYLHSFHVVHNLRWIPNFFFGGLGFNPMQSASQKILAISCWRQLHLQNFNMLSLISGSKWFAQFKVGRFLPNHLPNPKLCTISTNIILHCSANPNCLGMYRRAIRGAYNVRPLYDAVACWGWVRKD